MIPADNSVRRFVEARVKCTRLGDHGKLLPPENQGVLTKSESLDPDDILRYVTCGLCAGVIEIKN